LDHVPDRKDAPINLETLLKPQSYKVRLYVLMARGLTPMDVGWNGRPGKSDPYLFVQLGKEQFNGRDKYVDDAVEVEFHTMIELNAELPGAGQLVIKVNDYDTFGTDDMIGSTTIDLEDRWFDKRWQALGHEYEKKEAEKIEDVRWKVKPIELRELHQPPSKMFQGNLECWVDILLPGTPIVRFRATPIV
jgi:hypothetical protein